MNTFQNPSDFQGWKFVSVNPYIRFTGYGPGYDDGDLQAVHAFIFDGKKGRLNPEFDEAAHEMFYAIPPGDIYPAKRLMMPVSVMIEVPGHFTVAPAE